MKHNFFAQRSIPEQHGYSLRHTNDPCFGSAFSTHMVSLSLSLPWENGLTSGSPAGESLPSQKCWETWTMLGKGNIKAMAAALSPTL